MKCIMIFAIVACASFQAMAQQSSEPNSLKISGLTSLHSSDPLFIVSDDQVSTEIAKEEFERINARDIQSISVLKDPQVLQIYGERGKNGVVLIVMKGDSFSETFPGNTQPAKEK